ncbi:zinc finger MYM-type protein 1-like [Rhopalosiphum maidis]|uniref:zinc finger MYM-type protein 1-like n=1 Tax=Rhopalosiphum maidis TaxID=43146 RepID=UPI000EFEB646|nr:zinc finger MYM-type protein 1-like [Rhopalosiphum maidis]
MFCHHCLLFWRNINTAWSVDGVVSWSRTLSKEKYRRDKAINKEIFQDLIDITFFLAKNCIAFRGHKESLKEELDNRENFLDLVHLMSKRSPSLASSIRTSIQEELKIARFFSISVDSTFDLSRKEQISFVVRYVNSTAGTYLVGQSYDGAQNMRGKFRGLKTYVQQKCPSAIFIWYYAHRLNLIVAKSVGCNLNAIDLFGNLESVYNFICGSKKRVAIYETKQDYYYGKRTHRLERVATTRWMSHGYALNYILETFKAVSETLDNVRNKEGCNDQSTGYIAGCLIEYVLSRRILLIAFCFKYIFGILGSVNILLQRTLLTFSYE